MNPADLRAAGTEMEKNGMYQESEEQTKLKGFLVGTDGEKSLLGILREATISQNKWYLFK